MYAMMSRFSVGFSWLSPKTGMFWGPVNIAA
jgi:hypothetical protein